MARGLNRKALTIAEAYAKMEDQHRDGFDTTLVIARKAIGYPMQAELFAAPAASPGDGDPAATPPPDDDDDDGDQEPETEDDTELEHAGPGAEGLSDADVKQLCADNHVPYDPGDPGGSYARVQSQLGQSEARTH